MTASDVVRGLDKRPAPATARSEIAYQILANTNRRNKLVSEIMNEYRLGFIDQERLDTLREELSNERDRGGRIEDRAMLHLAWGLLPSDDRLDGYLAEYYYDWAKSLHIEEERVSRIIMEYGLAV